MLPRPARPSCPSYTQAGLRAHHRQHRPLTSLSSPAAPTNTQDSECDRRVQLGRSGLASQLCLLWEVPPRSASALTGGPAASPQGCGPLQWHVVNTRGNRFCPPSSCGTTGLTAALTLARLPFLLPYVPSAPSCTIDSLKTPTLFAFLISDTFIVGNAGNLLHSTTEDEATCNPQEKFQDHVAYGFLGLISSSTLQGKCFLTLDILRKQFQCPHTIYSSFRDTTAYLTLPRRGAGRVPRHGDLYPRAWSYRLPSPFP